MMTGHSHLRHRWIETILNESFGSNNSSGSGDGDAADTQYTSSSSSPPTSSSSTSTSLTVLGSLIVMALFIILGISVWYITWCTMRYYRQRKLRRDILLLRAATHHTTDGNAPATPDDDRHTTIVQDNPPWYYMDETASFERMQRRYETIEHWIITKRAQEHTACCSTIQVQRSNSMSSSQHQTLPIPTPTQLPFIVSDKMEIVHDEKIMNDMEHECPICMGELEVGQSLSWSSNPQCIHVYHHECIKEWLLRHKECCMCKQTFLPIDAKQNPPPPPPQQQLEKTQNAIAIPNYINELSQQFRASVATSYYCIEHGLIRIPELFYCTQSELEQLEHHIIDGTIAPIDLISLRGSATATATTTNNDDGNPTDHAAIHNNTTPNGSTSSQPMESAPTTLRAATVNTNLPFYEATPAISDDATITTAVPIENQDVYERVELCDEGDDCAGETLPMEKINTVPFENESNSVGIDDSTNATLSRSTVFPNHHPSSPILPSDVPYQQDPSSIERNVMQATCLESTMTIANESNSSMAMVEQNSIPNDSEEQTLMSLSPCVIE